MREYLVKLGLDPARVSVGAPSPQPLKDQLVGSKMNLGAEKRVAVEPVPTAPSGASAP